MQDPQTGNMIEVSEEVAKEADKHGFCVLAKGEKTVIKGETFNVFNFSKKGITLEKTQDRTDFIIGEKLNIKTGNFKVESIGNKFIMLRGLPGNSVIDNAVLDRIKKEQIKKIRNETIKREAGKE